MKKVPSALKWLAEKRGRVAHDLQQTTAIAEQVGKKLERLTLDLASLDRVIQVYDAAIDPQAIAPIAAWKGRYGDRGALKATVVRHLQVSAPEWMSTNNLEFLVLLDLQVGFATAAERKRWYENSFRRCLKKLVETGHVERLHDPLDCGSDVGAWRWRQDGAGTLASLQQA
jgi:hypothetical protein